MTLVIITKTDFIMEAGQNGKRQNGEIFFSQLWPFCNIYKKTLRDFGRNKSFIRQVRYFCEARENAIS
jgi:hypothetical protein